MTQEELDDLAEWQRSERFDKQQRAILAYTDAMTWNVHVPQSVFDAVNSILTSRLVVELTATVAAYNVVSRFLEALQSHSIDKVLPDNSDLPEGR